MFSFTQHFAKTLAVLFAFLIFTPAYSDNCMDITTFTNKMTNVVDWNSHYRFYSELEGCRDGMYAIKLEDLGVGLLQTQWEQLWKKQKLVSDTAYVSLLVSGVHTAREDEKDGGDKVNIPIKCPPKSSKTCAEFLKRIKP